MGSIYKIVVAEIEDLVVNLLRRAISENIRLDTLILTGGFGDSPFLRTAIRDRLHEYNLANDLQIEFIVTPGQQCKTATAIGGLLRALNKENGPVRALRMSVVVTRKIPRQTDVYKDMAYPRS
jgi:hypothetical protein